MTKTVDAYILHEMEEQDIIETMVESTDEMNDFIDSMMEEQSKQEELDELLPVREKFAEPKDYDIELISNQIDNIIV